MEEEAEEEEEEEEEISKDSPMYVPKGVYFQHDSRSEEQENEEDVKRLVGGVTLSIDKCIVIFLFFVKKLPVRGKGKKIYLSIILIQNIFMKNI